MRNISILLLSDIHLNITKDVENQGLVISEFFKDIDKTLKDIPFDDRFCIISGDLVQAGGLSQSYVEFVKRFLEPLKKQVALKNIICIPGNHDLNRPYVESHKTDYDKWIAIDEDETAFNKAAKEDEYFKKAFEHFITFRDENLVSDGQSIFGFSKNLIPEISVMCLNSAILSNGGLDEKSITPPFSKDRELLRIETSGLYEWVENNDGRTKILVMHHPVKDLTEYLQHQLDALVKKSVDIQINGHTHFQTYEPKHHNGRVIHTMTSPQLFSTKKDETNGYSLLHFQGSELKTIRYRQWSPKNQRFMAGIELADNDEDTGIVTVEVPNVRQKMQDQILKTKLEESLLIFNYTMPWCHRALSTSITPNQSKEEKSIDYLDILNSKDNYQIVAPPQFGLTSFARFLAYKAQEVKDEKWAYLDMLLDCNHSNIENKLRFASQEVGFDIKELNGVLLDNWNGQLKDRLKIIEKIQKVISGVRIVLLCNMADAEVLAGIDTEESHKGFKLFYLRELSRQSIRTLVEAFNEDYHIADTNFLLDRLIIDIDALNEHRTPLNCMQLLMAYRNNFETHPVNRSRVLELVLDVIFKNSNTLYYNDALDEKDCCNIMGVIAYELYKKESDYFTWDEFKQAVMTELPMKYTESQIKDLLSILVNSQILESTYYGYRFHFVYWVFYFVAYRMYASEECFNEMIVNKKQYYNEDIVEFYSAINDKSDGLVTILVEKLTELANKVNVNIGRPFWNPYDSLKWNQNETTKGKTTEQVESEIEASRLPDDLKDSIKDKNYDAVKPYNQPIQRVFEEYEVRNLMNLARAASRALRNCHLVEGGLLIALRNSIYVAWVELFKVLILLAPALAKTGYGGVGGANFKLSGDFSDEFNECIKQIVCAIPLNIIGWYKNDFFSEKRVAMYYDAMQNDTNPVVRHLNARVLVECRPKNWREMITSYIASLGKNTYFLGDIYAALRQCYKLDSMSDEDLRVTKGLILTCYTKHKDGGTLPSLQASNKNAGEVDFPKRLSE
ncbi:MAG: metallophosphoesterase [Bacteroidales bacterium]|nr:metallophosphoesterase [Bacteroidales bacterium]